MAKRRAHNEGTIYKRKDGRWVAAVTMPDGRQRSFYARTQQAARKKLAAAKRAQDAGLPLPSERETVGAYMRRWLDEVAQPTIRVRTYENYDGVIRNHILPDPIAHVRLGRLTAEALSGLYGRLLAKGLSASTVRLVHKVLHRAFVQARRWNLVAHNPVELVDPPAAPRPDLRVLSLDETQRLLSEAAGDRLAALFVLAVTTGCRQGELLGLEWDSIDWERGTIRIHHQLQRIKGTWTFSPPKSASGDRTVKLTALGIAALRQHQARQAAERLAAGPPWDNPSGLCFTTTLGTPIDSRNLLRRSYYPLLERAGLPRVTFHALRHSCATVLSVLDVPPKVVADILGHSSATLTLNVYSHVSAAMQEDAMRRLDAALSVA